MMDEFFLKFLENIGLTSTQKEDARIKYNWVCQTVHNYFYDKKYDGSTKLLFWSYRKDTNIRPITESHDVDVLIRLPIEVYEQYNSHQSNWQSNLIQKIKEILKDSYTTTDRIKWWWKVILVAFKDGTHNVELLPAFEQGDWSFIIPNSEAWWSWEIFNPKAELGKFFESNKETSGLTRNLSKIIKKWKRGVSWLTIKSYKIEEYVIKFLDSYDYQDKSYAVIIHNFFQYLLNQIDASNSTFVQTAIDRSKNALNYLEEEKLEKAVEEWQKIFWSQFPSFIKQYTELDKSSMAPKEQFIKDIVSMHINPLYRFKLDCEIQMDWFLRDSLSNFIRRGSRLPKKRTLTFKIKEINIPFPYSIKWKVRNYGAEAKDNNDLRWEITDWWMEKVEGTKYWWEHFIECYIIKDGNCVAIQKLDVPII